VAESRFFFTASCIFVDVMRPRRWGTLLSFVASQETHYVSTIEPNRLMLFGDTVAVYCNSHSDREHTLCEENTVFRLAKGSSTDSYHSALKG
jgi:hypothetical protein